MQLIENRLILSASDLVNYVECPHLSALDLRVARGIERIEKTRSDTGDLVAGKGDEHEAAHLQSLKAQDLRVVEIPEADDGLAGLEAAAKATREALASGADVVYQAALVDGDWRGFADFLERVDRPSPLLGDFSYEVVDTKLARRTKPDFLIQLCFYSELLSELQGVRPEHMHVVLGNGERVSFRVDEFFAYYRRLKARYGELLTAGFKDTYPEPVSHCGLCRWSDHCDQVWLDDDHLSLVAAIGKSQRVRLSENGIDTVAGLGAAQPADRPKRVGEPTFERLRQQARLQVHERTTGEQVCEVLEPEEGRGFALLPRPSKGDLFFDMEGDPFYEDGLEYLFGVTRIEDGEPVFRSFWGRDRAEEKQAFEAFIDFVMAALHDDPDLHVYHYASYEQTALKTLMGRHGTREEEVDHLLRSGVLVDLYQVVRQALRISKPSYSIKKVEAFYMPPRDEAVTDAGDSIIQFEEWLNTGEQRLLDEIEAYNEVDCLSTVRLRDWLLERRHECERQHGVEIAWRPVVAGEPSDSQAEASEEVLALQQSLLTGVSEDPALRSDEEQSRWLLAQLLAYHRRDEKPYWWEFFSRFEKSEEELETEDSEALAGLRPVGDPVELPAPARSLIHTLSFPPQEHKISEGSFADPSTAQIDPQTGKLDPFSAQEFNIERVIQQEGLIEIRRATAKRDEPLPHALIPSTYYDTKLQQAALHELGADVIEHGLASAGRHGAARAILQRALPRTATIDHGTPLQPAHPDLDSITSVVSGLQDSYLFIQGPPGSGKTYTGAHLILTLLGQGHRVGVTANSHTAIHNLLHEVELYAADRGVEFRGLQKHSGGDSRFVSRLDEPLVDATQATNAFPTGDGIDLMAGTAWLWCRQEMRASVDYLVIDEAGQISLADALALATSARNVVLLGDPLQLAQVSQGTHPPGAGCSVLEHLLADHGTIPPDRGVFLDHTRRMHPDVCEFVSEVVYESRLSSIPECSGQTVEAPGELTGTGVRYLEADHAGNTRCSIEEADVIATAIEDLRRGTWTNDNGQIAPLPLSEIMVVTPYNSQVRLLYERLPDGVRIGTVDKFQGQEAAVVFFSMATSSGAEIPRNVEFLYSRNRLNVAVSRARCLAALVCSPELVHINCRTAEQMRLVNALCRLVELVPE